MNTSADVSKNIAENMYMFLFICKELMWYGICKTPKEIDFCDKWVCTCYLASATKTKRNEISKLKRKGDFLIYIFREYLAGDRYAVLYHFKTW
jgi:hypothetical protein